MTVLAKGYPFALVRTWSLPKLRIYECLALEIMIEERIDAVMIALNPDQEDPRALLDHYRRGLDELRGTKNGLKPGQVPKSQTQTWEETKAEYG